MSGVGHCGRGAGEHVWQEGVHGTHASPPDTTRYGQSIHGRYASYWNAFLFQREHIDTLSTVVACLLMAHKRLHGRGGSRIPHRRGRQPSRRGRQPMILPKMSKKTQEIEEYLGRRGGEVGGAGDVTVRSATAWYYIRVRLMHINEEGQSALTLASVLDDLAHSSCYQA